MTRTVIVDAGSAMRLQPSARVLHRYANGEVLLSTDGPGVEAERDAALPLVLPEQVRGQLDAARATLDAVPDGLRIPAYVELLGPPDGAMLAQLRHIGVMPQQFVPARSYLCVGTGAQLRAARKLPFVAAVTPVNRNLKPQPLTGEDPAAYIAVSVVASAALADADTLAHELAGVDGVRVDGPAETAGALVSLPARINGSGKEALLNDPRILRIEPRAPRQVEDEVADLIVAGRYSASGQPAGSYVEWLDDHGISGAGVTIGIVDQGVDITHPAFTGRINDLAGGKRDWHGTFVAGHAAGAFMDHRDGAGFVYGIGIAPSATLLAQDNQKSGSELGAETVDAADGAAAIQNNSWGAGLQDPMDYQSQEAIYDGLVRNAARSGAAVPLTICFSSGNNGEDGLTRPKAAKNLIISGNSESYRPDVGGAESDDIRQVYSGAHASSHGNCGDGRIRPHVVAPGEWTASANYDSHPGEKEYVDDKITWGGGSSGASPKTAGACALLTHWWRNHNNGALPSPAMLRALVVNGAEPIDAGGTIPNMVQGWGRLNVDNIVRDDVHRTFIDQSILLTTRGDSRSWTICPSDPSQPLYITLAGGARHRHRQRAGGRQQTGAACKFQGSAVSGQPVRAGLVACRRAGRARGLGQHPVHSPEGGRGGRLHRDQRHCDRAGDELPEQQRRHPAARLRAGGAQRFPRPRHDACRPVPHPRRRQRFAGGAAGRPLRARQFRPRRAG
jgi:subtilisin family serine protease